MQQLFPFDEVKRIFYHLKYITIFQKKDWLANYIVKEVSLFIIDLFVFEKICFEDIR